jgi:murein DD-endopeptidase MepM/ murein hydrolase activator NlpD
MRRFIPLLIALFVFPPSAEAAWVWPVSGDVITPYRNGTDPYATGQHRGIDIAAPVGTPVVAAAGGEVRFAGTVGSSGLTIGIRSGEGYDTSYLHLSSLSVKAGARVSAGDRIGAVGTTGTRSATTPHLHFGVRDAGTRHGYHDPLALLPPPASAPSAEPPAPAPAPAPMHAPAPPAAAPVTAPRVAPVASPGRVRTRVPHGRPVSRPAPAPTGVRTPRPVPSAGPLFEPDRTQIAGTGPFRPAAPHSPPSRDTRPDHLPLGRGGPVLGPARSHADEARLPVLEHRSPSTRQHRLAGGPDIGWVAACAGLLLAAAILGLTADRRSPQVRSGARLIAALRPMFGRR